MKKLFTSVMMLLFATSFAFAQEAALVRFVDEAGNEYADGSVIDITEGEEDVFGDYQFPTGLYVENISGEDIYVGVDYEIVAIPNGSFQICFPENCVQQSKKGSYSTQQGPMKTDAKKDLQAEWLPEENGFGTCSVKIQVNIYTKNVLTGKFNLDENGPKVTVNMIFKDPASVKNVENEAKAVAKYNAAGQQVNNEQKGLNIVKLDNGKAVKVINQ